MYIDAKARNYGDHALSLPKQKIFHIDNKIKNAALFSLFIAIAAALLVSTVLAVETDTFLPSSEYNARYPVYNSTNTSFSGYCSEVNALICIGDTITIVRTPVCTVRELISSMGIVLSPDDIISLPLDEVVADNTELTVSFVKYETSTVDVILPFETETVKVQTIPRGTTEVVRAGANGEAVREVRRKLVDGEAVSEETLSETVIVSPVNRLVRYGTGGTMTGADGKEYTFSYYIDVIATVYTGGGVTKSGKAVKEGHIAVDPRVIALGTKVYVTGDYGDYGVCSAEDTGGLIKGNRIDIYMEADRQTLLNFGKRSMRVYILD